MVNGKSTVFTWWHVEFGIALAMNIYIYIYLYLYIYIFIYIYIISLYLMPGLSTVTRFWEAYRVLQVSLYNENRTNPWKKGACTAPENPSYRVEWRDGGALWWWVITPIEAKIQVSNMWQQWSKNLVVTFRWILVGCFWDASILAYIIIPIYIAG